MSYLEGNEGWKTVSIKDERLLHQNSGMGTNWKNQILLKDIMGYRDSFSSPATLSKYSTPVTTTHGLERNKHGCHVSSACVYFDAQRGVRRKMEAPVLPQYPRMQCAVYKMAVSEERSMGYGDVIKVKGLF